MRLSAHTVTVYSTLFAGVLAKPLQRPLAAAAPVHEEKYNLDPSARYGFTGVTTYHGLPTKDCLADEGVSEDILVVGYPFDTATSLRTGTRFGPNAIRQGSRIGTGL